MSVFPWARHVFSPNRQVLNRILIVADGRIGFNESTFGLSELLSVLQTTTQPWDSISITTAHRSKNLCKDADIPLFTFDMIPPAPHLPFSIQNYDQLWLFGDLDARMEGITQVEVNKIIEFMNAGGGVFATGDHQDIGVSLCGEIPRVRTMRMWRSPPAPDRDGPTRLDTLRQGTEKSFQSTDQSDGTPQEIRPRFSMDSQGQKISFAHPLLRNGKFAITVLPDHMHEGECKLPSIDELNGTYPLSGSTGWAKEYPRSNDDSQVIPELVAISTSAGGLVVDDVNVNPVEPRAFPIIVAYDGHLVRPQPLGRVVVDSSFHHFVDVNLKGTGAPPGHTGFFDSAGNPTEDYAAIKQYFRNIASWLKPPTKQRQFFLNVLVALRYMTPLIEEVTSSSPYTAREILFIGSSTRSSLSDRLSSVDAVLCAIEVSQMLADPEKSIVRNMIDPFRKRSLDRNERDTPAIDPDLFVNALLGTAMISIARALPEDGCEVGSRLDEFENSAETIERVVIRGLSQGMSVLGQILRTSSRTLQLERLITQTNRGGLRSNEYAADEREEKMDTKSKCAGNWDSERGSKKEKTKVDDDGKKGHHITKDKPMTVGCLADGMTWDVDDGDEHLHYSGDFDGEDHGLPHEDHVTGTCKTTKSKVESRKDQPTDDSEDWEGTKTT